MCVMSLRVCVMSVRTCVCVMSVRDVSCACSYVVVGRRVRRIRPIRNRNLRTKPTTRLLKLNLAHVTLEKINK